MTIISRFDRRVVGQRLKRWWLDTHTTLGAALAVLAALGLVGINEIAYRQSNRALADIGEAQSVRLWLGELQQTLLEAETSQRGFLLTGEAAYRAPYDKAVGQIDRQLGVLRTLYADRPDERARLLALSGHVTRKLSEMDMSIRMRQQGNNDAWRFVLTTDIGREEMAAIHRITTELMDDSTRSLLHGQAQIARALQMARVGIGVVALAALLAFGLYLRQTYRLRQAGESQQRALEHERNMLEDEVRERTASLAELATHLQDVRETERGYLARELHDELGSLLTAAKLDVARLRSRLADSPEPIQRLQHLNELLNSGIALKRRIIEDLRPSSLANLGLVASLEILGREFTERSGVQVEMALEPVALDEATQLTIYRMVQEGMTNIGKYAQATEATIVLKNYGNHVVIELADNGRGFDPRQVQPATHGLAGMRHRVEAAHGRLTVSAAPGQGTRISARLPATPGHPRTHPPPTDSGNAR